MNKATFKKLILGIIIGLGILALLLAVSIKIAEQKKPSGLNVPVVKNISNRFEYIIDKGVGDKLYYTRYLAAPNEKQTVFDALKTLSKENNFELKYNNNYSFGVFVESIEGVKNGNQGKYWQYYINGKLGEVAADKKEIKAGDKVEWKFEKANF